MHFHNRSKLYTHSNTSEENILLRFVHNGFCHPVGTSYVHEWWQQECLKILLYLPSWIKEHSHKVILEIGKIFQIQIWVCRFSLPIFSHNHSLRTPKSSECCVWRYISFTNMPFDSHWTVNFVRVGCVKHCPSHYRKRKIHCTSSIWIDIHFHGSKFSCFCEPNFIAAKKRMPKSCLFLLFWCESITPIRHRWTELCQM